MTEWEMPGTESGSIYTIVAKCQQGVVGYRDLDNNIYRVRVVTDAYIQGFSKHEDHLSVVVEEEKHLRAAIYKAIRILNAL